MRLSTLVKAASLAAIAAAIALVAVVKSIDFQRYKGVLTGWVHDSTGRELMIAGPLKLKLGLVPTITASGLTFANAPWGSRKDMVTAERIEAQVALLPLLLGEVDVRRLVLFGPDILLETARDGRANWRLATGSAAPLPPGPATAGAPPTRFDIGDIQVRDARLTWRDGASGRAETVTLAQAAVQPDAGGRRLALQLAGTFHGKDFTLSGSVGTPATRPWPLDLKGGIAGALLVAGGTIADPAALTGLMINLSANGDELSSLLDLAGVTRDGRPPPRLGPFKLSARLTGSGDRPGLDQVDAAVGRRDAVLLATKGSVGDLAHGSGFDLAVEVEGDSLAGLSGLAGTPLPATGPLRLAARVTTDSGTWRLAELTGRLGGSDLAGALAVTLGARPRVTGRLAFGTLALADFTAPPAAASGQPAAPARRSDGRLLSAAPLPLAALDDMDADLALSATRIATGYGDLTDATARLRLDHGRLGVEPVTARLAGGAVTAALAVDSAPGRIATVTARLHGADIELGRMLHEAAGSDALAGGPTRVTLDLHARGASPRALAASLDGEAVASVGPGRIRNTAIDWAGGDLALQVLGSLDPLAKSEDTTDLQCAALRFTLRHGIATADKGIAAETPKVAVVGGGTVDLRSEAIDIAIAPRAREGMGVNLGNTLAGLTRIGGTLADPTLTVDEAGAARTAASVGAAVATGGLSLLGQLIYDKAIADPHPCRTALGRQARRGSRSLLDGWFGQ